VHNRGGRSASRCSMQRRSREVDSIVRQRSHGGVVVPGVLLMLAGLHAAGAADGAGIRCR
jgi:hypothetical protein